MRTINTFPNPGDLVCNVKKLYRSILTLFLAAAKCCPTYGPYAHRTLLDATLWPLLGVIMRNARHIRAKSYHLERRIMPLRDAAARNGRPGWSVADRETITGLLKGLSHFNAFGPLRSAPLSPERCALACEVLELPPERPEATTVCRAPVRAHLYAAITRGRAVEAQTVDDGRIILFVGNADDRRGVRRMARERLANLTAAARLSSDAAGGGGLVIGAAWQCSSGRSLAILLRSAVAAFDDACSAGTPKVRFLGTRAREKLQLHARYEADLVHALERNQLRLHYQPQVDLRSNRVIGAEALMRWTHPSFGRVPPSIFIPIAERRGQIKTLGRWLLWEACARASHWLATGQELRIAVNISAVQLRGLELPHAVAQTLRATGLPPHLLELELTETCFIDTSITRIHDCFHELARLGVRVAIDDFGTAYSTLGTLRELPVEKLKIDKRFVAGIGRNAADEGLVRGIIQLARSLDKRILAEGVETEHQRAFLTAEGCDEAQGFLMSRPLPEDVFPHFLELRTQEMWLRGALTATSGSRSRRPNAAQPSHEDEAIARLAMF